MCKLAALALILIHIPVHNCLSGAICSSAFDCKLNGDCVHPNPSGHGPRGPGRCACDPAWSGSPDCAVLAFEPMHKEHGKATGYYNATEASWGGNIVKVRPSLRVLSHTHPLSLSLSLSLSHTHSPNSNRRRSSLSPHTPVLTLNLDPQAAPQP